MSQNTKFRKRILERGKRAQNKVSLLKNICYQTLIDLLEIIVTYFFMYFFVCKGYSNKKNA